MTPVVHRGWAITAVFITNGVDGGWWEWRAYDPETPGWRAGTAHTRREAIEAARLWVDTQEQREAA